MKITRAQDYRRAIREAQKLDEAREGTPEFARRQELRAAMHAYEVRLQHPACRKGRLAREV